MTCRNHRKKIHDNASHRKLPNRADGIVRKGMEDLLLGVDCGCENRPSGELSDTHCRILISNERLK